MPSHRRRSGSSDRATILSLLLGIPLWIVIAYVIIEAGLPKGYGIIVGLVIPLAAVVVVYIVSRRSHNNCHGGIPDYTDLSSWGKGE